MKRTILATALSAFLILAPASAAMATDGHHDRGGYSKHDKPRYEKPKQHKDKPCWMPSYGKHVRGDSDQCKPGKPKHCQGSAKLDQKYGQCRPAHTPKPSFTKTPKPKPTCQPPTVYVKHHGCKTPTPTPTVTTSTPTPTVTSTPTLNPTPPVQPNRPIPELPVTGSSVPWQLALMVFLVVAGAVALGVAGRRNGAHR